MKYRPTEAPYLHASGRLSAISSFTTRRIVFFILGVGALIGWLYVIIMSDLFTLSKVDVLGTKLLDPVDVSREVFDLLDQRRGWRPWSTRNTVFLQKEELQEALKERLFAEHVTVDNIHFNVLRLMVEERAKRVIFHSHKQYFWVDLSGVVTNELSHDERADVQARLLGHRRASLNDPPVIHRDLDEQIATGYVIQSSEDIRSWVQLSLALMKGELYYREFIPPQTVSSTMVSITAPEGYRVLVDLGTPLELQLDTYRAFKRAQAKIKVAEYLDIRIPGRVYVK